MTCENCRGEFPIQDVDSLEVGHTINKTRKVMGLCPSCLRGAKTIKIVLTRNKEGAFEYEQYTAIEMTAKAFGKAHG